MRNDVCQRANAKVAQKRWKSNSCCCREAVTVIITVRHRRHTQEEKIEDRKNARTTQ